MYISKTQNFMTFSQQESKYIIAFLLIVVKIQLHSHEKIYMYVFTRAREWAAFWQNGHKLYTGECNMFNV